MKRSTTTVIALGALVGLWGVPQPAKASPCDTYRNQYYCYIWLPATRMNPLARVAIAGLGGRRPQDVVLVSPRNGIYVEAMTPYGYASGVWNGNGDVRLNNGIVCYGLRSSAQIVGRTVDYGFCDFN